jgi:putative restriction endonuclease
MRINAFFRDVLLAPVKGTQWSWGAVDINQKRVFLRLWDEGGEYSPGKKIIVLHTLEEDKEKRPNYGWRERKKQLSLLDHQFFGVLCRHSSNPDPKSARIGKFDNQKLLMLDNRWDESDGKVYARIKRIIAIDELHDLPERRLAEDLREIGQTASGITEKEALIQARVGQGIFRQMLLERYGSACAVTGCKITEILRASHIKPWRDAKNNERLDVSNGILLNPTLDALFDIGLITFHKKSGKILVSPTLTPEAAGDIPAQESLKIPPDESQQKYLAWHKAHIFRA